MTMNSISDKDLVGAICRQIDAAISSAAIRASENMKKLGAMALLSDDAARLRENYQISMERGEELKASICKLLDGVPGAGRGVTAVESLPVPAAAQVILPIAGVDRAPAVAAVPAQTAKPEMTAIVVNGGLIDKKSRAVMGVTYTSAVKGLTATIIDTGDGIVILEGSQILAPENSNLTSKQYLADRKEILRTAKKGSDGIHRLDRDFTVRTPTAAMSIVTGMNRNGMGWRDADNNTPPAGHGMSPENQAIITEWVGKAGAIQAPGRRRYEGGNQRYLAPAPSSMDRSSDAAYHLHAEQLKFLTAPGYCGYLLLAFGGGVIQIDAGLVELENESTIINVVSVNGGHSAQVRIGKVKTMILNIQSPSPKKD